MITEQQATQLWDYHNSVEASHRTYREAEAKLEVALKHPASAPDVSLVDLFNSMKQERFVYEQMQTDYYNLKAALKI